MTKVYFKLYLFLVGSVECYFEKEDKDKDKDQDNDRPGTIPYFPLKINGYSLDENGMIDCKIMGS